MVSEVKVYSDVEKTKEVVNDVNLGVVKAGETTTKNLFLENKIKFPINYELKLTGTDVALTKFAGRIEPGSTEEIDILFSPELTTMQPITAQLEMKIDYIIT